MVLPAGGVPPTVVNALSRPKYLRLLSTGFDAGEDGPNRTVMARTIKFRVAVAGYEWLSDEEIAVLLGLARQPRGMARGKRGKPTARPGDLDISMIRRSWLREISRPGPCPARPQRT